MNKHNCVYCQEPTSCNLPGTSHVVCRKVEEGLSGMEIYQGMVSCTMVPGQFEKELERLFARLELRARDNLSKLLMS